MAVQVSMPPITEPMLDDAGNVSVPWYRFFQATFNRTGGAEDSVSAASSQAGAAASQADSAGSAASAAAAAADAAAAAARGATNQANSSAATGNNAQAAATPTAPQEQYATDYALSPGHTFSPVVTVNFPSAVSASAVSALDSGPTMVSGAFAAGSGMLRLVRIIGSTTTVLDTRAFSFDDAGVITFSGFPALGADTSTGSITYQIDARLVGGGGDDPQITIYLHIRRTP